MNKIIAYTDGSAVLKYPYCGGIGVYIKSGKKSYKLSKGFCNTKTGRMELTAVIYCLRAIVNKQSRVVIRSDSQYVCNTCNKWIDNWERNQFHEKKNVDLLKQLLHELRQFTHRPKLIHIKGHQEVIDEHTEGNNIVDRLADYKRHGEYQIDQEFKDLSEFEKDDFYQKDGKLYYNPEAYIEKEFENYKNKQIKELKKDMPNEKF